MNRTSFISIFKNRLSLIILSLLFTALLAGCGGEPKDSSVLLQRAVNLAVKDGKWHKSLEYSQKAVAADTQNVDAIVMYALALEQNNQPTKALQELRKAVKLNPKNFLAQLSLGRFLYIDRDYEGSYEFLANAYNLHPENIDALILLAQCSAKLQAQNTDKLFLKLAQTEYFKNKPEIYNELGTYYAKTNNLSLAAKNLSKAYKLSPKNPIIVSNLGIFCDQFLRRPKKARFFYRKFISLTSSNPAFDIQRKEVSSRLKAIANL